MPLIITTNDISLCTYYIFQIFVKESVIFREVLFLTSFFYVYTLLVHIKCVVTKYCFSTYLIIYWARFVLKNASFIEPLKNHRLFSYKLEPSWVCLIEFSRFILCTKRVKSDTDNWFVERSSSLRAKIVCILQFDQRGLREGSSYFSPRNINYCFMIFFPW